MSQQPSAYDTVVEDIVIANRLLAAEGVLDGYGHVSARDPRDPKRYLISRSRAPALITSDDIQLLDLDSNPVEGKGPPLYYERFIHGEIYKARPDVHAIVHSHSPTVVPFASTKAPLRPILHNAAFLGAGTPVFEIRNFVANSDMLISSPELGKALAQALGPTAQVALLRGHGDVVVGPTMPIAVYRAYYTEVNARQQLNAIILGPNDVVYLDAGEAATTDKLMKDVVGRPWELWKRRVHRDMRRAAAEGEG